MSNDRTRRPRDARDIAEAAFKKVTTKPVVEPAPPRPAIPNAKEQVTLRLDHDVLEHFREGGPGWQDRINDALRTLVGK